MKNILAPPQRELLRQIVWSNTLIAADFDGTLAPIVPVPDAAALRSSTRRLLAELAALFPVAVISGRSRSDVLTRLVGIRVRAVVGNHGLETESPSRRHDRVREWADELGNKLAGLAGVVLEDKGYSLAIHYRASRSRKTALEAISAAVSGLAGAPRILGGKLVVNVLPEGAPHKGAALLRLREEVRADTALYIGDDVTDEDVFALDDPGRLLCVRVGRAHTSRAPYFVQKQRRVDELLRQLVRLRRFVRGSASTRGYA